MKKVIFSLATIVALGLVGCGAGGSSGGSGISGNAIPAGGNVNAPNNAK